MTSAGARAGAGGLFRDPDPVSTQMAPVLKKQGVGGNTQSGNTIPWENWLHGAFSGVSRRQQGLVIFYLFIGLMWWLLHAPRAAGMPRVGVDMTQMLFKDAHHGLTVSPLFPDGKGPLGRMGSLTPGGSSGSGNASPQLPSWSSPGSCGHQLSPPFERSRQMLSCLLRRWVRKQHSVFRVQSSAGPNPPPHPVLKHQPSVPLSRVTTSPWLPRSPCTPLGRGLRAASRALAAPGQSSSFIILCRPGPAVAVCNREAGRERKFLKSASARTENICPGGKRVPRGARGSRRA